MKGVKGILKLICDAMVPKTDDGESLLLEGLSTLLIVFELVRMMSAVELDDEFKLSADEVDDVRFDLVLPVEFVARELSVS